MRTIKDIRKDLKVWGNYWRNQRKGKGFSRQSSITRIGEQPSSKGCLQYSTANISTPIHIEATDRLIEQLSKVAKLVIIHKYVKHQPNNTLIIDEVNIDIRTFNALLVRAELAIL